MTSSAAPSPGAAPRPGPWSLAFAVLGAPGAWLAHLSLSYLLVPRACGSGTSLWLHLVTAVTAAVALAATVVAARIRAASTATVPQFVGTLGLFVGTLFLVATLVEGLPVLFIDPCR